MTTMKTALMTALVAWYVTSATAATSHDVDVGPGFDFTPADVVIYIGDTVRWTWVSGLHNVESGVGGVHDGIFRSGNPVSTPGTAFEVTFDQAYVGANPVTENTYDYYCAVHFGSGMVGSVQVITCPGDLTGDDTVGLSDLAQLLGSYGTPSGASYHDGDLDFDGDVDLSDLAELLGVYGAMCG